MSTNESQSLIKTPKQLIIVGLLGILVPVLGAVMVAYFVVTSSKKPDSEHSSMAAEDMARRIKPVADVVIAEPDAGGAKAMKSGEEIYKTVCLACHGSGAAGAPKFGDKAAWSKLIAQGQKTMVANGMKGVRAMPPRGGAADLSDIEFERAVVYMANTAGGSFKEPALPKDKAAK
ncbi:MAG: cytochrome c5 family protein [Betaproteobacteria bacterium]|nr:cytochrome c5 family protein [Betaproteobacteria bacterium]